MIENKNRPYAVVAHDAGAANHIFSWISDEQTADEQIAMCLAGPAELIWRNKFENIFINPSLNSRFSNKRSYKKSLYRERDLVNCLEGAAAVITGTGWESNLEHDARKLARQMKIKSIAVVDHWVNYVDRFVRNGEQILPDEIWVCDEYAASIARETFPSINVFLKENIYLKNMVKMVKLLENNEVVKNNNDRVLYVLEPIRDSWGELAEPGEFMALEYFMEHRQFALISESAEIRLRPHPSDPCGKYDQWLALHAGSKVNLDQSATLTEAIAWSNVVVGCQTYAMVLALACDRTVISTVPSWAPSCRLPHEGIKKIDDLNPKRSI